MVHDPHLAKHFLLEVLLNSDEKDMVEMSSALSCPCLVRVATGGISNTRIRSVLTDMSIPVLDVTVLTLSGNKL